MQQGVPRGLAGPLAGYGVPPPFSLSPPPEAAQEKGDLNSYKISQRTLRRLCVDFSLPKTMKSKTLPSIL